MRFRVRIRFEGGIRPFTWEVLEWRRGIYNDGEEGWYLAFDSDSLANGEGRARTMTDAAWKAAKFISEQRLYADHKKIFNAYKKNGAIVDVVLDEEGSGDE